MKLLCISASNIEPFRQQSASTRACRIAAELAAERAPVESELLALIDFELNPCRMCGNCLADGRCCRDEAFNQIYERIQAADAVLLVTPHYAPIPSKVAMLCEKLQEIAFLNSCRDENYRGPLFKKPLGVVAHGGQCETPEILDYYYNALALPVANAFAGVGMRPLGVSAQMPRGAVFGIRALRMPEEGVFCTIEHDWDAIRDRLIPLVENLIAAAG